MTADSESMSMDQWKKAVDQWIERENRQKYIENGEHLVDLKVWAKNQDGIIHMPATATVRHFFKNRF